MSEELDQSKGYHEYMTVMLLVVKGGPDDEILCNANKAIEKGLSISEEALVRSAAGGAYLRQGRLQEAETEIKNALKFNEQSEEKFNALVYFGTCKDLAQVYEKEGDFKAAIKCLEDTVVHIQSNYDPSEDKGALAGALVEVGYYYLKYRNDLISADDQAFQNFQRAMEICDTVPGLYFYLGVLHGSKDINKYYDPAKAIKYYEQCLTQLQGLDDTEANTQRRIVRDTLELLRKKVESKEEKRDKEGETKSKSFFKKLFG